MDALKGGRKSIIDRGSRVRRLLPQVKHQLRPGILRPTALAAGYKFTAQPFYSALRTRVGSGVPKVRLVIRHRGQQSEARPAR